MCEPTAALVPAVNRAWSAAVRQLRVTGLLVEDLAAGTWAPGPGLEEIDTAGWPEGRAELAVRVVREQGESAVVEQLPDVIRRWVDAAA
jgi:hypothetical protein